MAKEGIAAGDVMDLNTALQQVLKTALIHDGPLCVIHEAAKALDKCQPHLCVLASNCDEPIDVKLVEALCADHQSNLIKVEDSKKLGEREASVVVKDYGRVTGKGCHLAVLQMQEMNKGTWLLFLRQQITKF